jgi:MoxR-like ATPase
MLKGVFGYPGALESVTVVELALERPVAILRVFTLVDLAALRAQVERLYVDPAVSRYAVALASATRSPEAAGIAEIGR